MQNLGPTRTTPAPAPEPPKPSGMGGKDKKHARTLKPPEPQHRNHLEPSRNLGEQPWNLYQNLRNLEPGNALEPAPEAAPNLYLGISGLRRLSAIYFGIIIALIALICIDLLTGTQDLHAFPSVQVWLSMTFFCLSVSANQSLSSCSNHAYEATQFQIC